MPPPDLTTRPLPTLPPPPRDEGWRILVVEDHTLLGELLIERFAEVEGVHEVLLARDVDDAMASYVTAAPDIVLLDFRLPSGTGIDVARDILAIDPCAKVIMLSATPDPLVASRAMDAGCIGFLDKTEPFWQLVQGVRRAVSGEQVLTPRKRASVSRVRATRMPDVDGLTGREREVLSLLAGGGSIGDIADELVLSTHTVRNHVRGACRKLRCSTQLQAVVIAAGQHAIELPEFGGAPPVHPGPG